MTKLSCHLSRLKLLDHSEYWYRYPWCLQADANDLRRVVISCPVPQCSSFYPSITMTGEATNKNGSVFNSCIHAFSFSKILVIFSCINNIFSPPFHSSNLMVKHVQNAVALCSPV